MGIVAVEFAQGIEDAWSNVAEFVPKLVVALVIFFIGWFVAKIIRNIVVRVLQRLKFDELVDRSGLGEPLERAGYADSAVLLAKLIYWGVMLLVLQLAIGVFGDSAVQDALNSIVSFLPKIFVAVVIVVITGAVASRVKDLIAATLNSQSYGNALASAGSIAIWLIGGFMALDQVDIAENIVNTLFTAIVGSLSLILVIKFGVGGIASARDRFWPKVYDKIEAEV